MAYTAIGLRGKKGLSLSQQSSEQITQRFTQYENNSYKANFLIRDTSVLCYASVSWHGKTELRFLEGYQIPEDRKKKQ